jgi:hypothetical protein
MELHTIYALVPRLYAAWTRTPRRSAVVPPAFPDIRRPFRPRRARPVYAGGLSSAGRAFGRFAPRPALGLGRF